MYQVVAFYKYVHIDEPEVYAVKHLKYCKRLGITGRILVAAEGLNGQLSGTIEQCRKYMDDLTADPRFAVVDFKIDPAPEVAFRKMHVRHKPEIVHSGLMDVDPSQETGKHLSAADFKELKDKEDVVVIDVRSNYETAVGRFKNAIIFEDMENFREFPDKLPELEKYKDKTVITYCTGGIKCEKASAFLLKNGFKDVYQLDGGVIKYGKEAAGEDFDGKLYVFDGRITVDVNTVNPTLITHCMHCNGECARYINCSDPYCNKKLIVCEDCGWKWEGACSEPCKDATTRREYDGSGYYAKPATDHRFDFGDEE